MRLCHSLLCDAAADVLLNGKAYCGSCALKIPPAKTVTPSPSGGSGEARPGGFGQRPEPPPLTLTWDELAEILRAERQWWEVEHDLKVLHNMTLNDLAARLEAELEATA